jgi:hypothetical protein
MNWTFKVATTTTNQFPTNWKHRRQDMGFRIVYLVKTYDIFATLMVNKDQIGMFLVPIARKWGWESKGTKHIKDRGQVTIDTCDFILCKWVATPLSSHIYKYHKKIYLQTMKENSCAPIIGQLWKP